MCLSSLACCRCDDAKAAISEEARLQHRPQHQRETLASRPLAEGATDSARIQLFWVNSCLSSVDERKSGVVRYKCARVCARVCVCVLSGEMVMWDLTRAGKQRWTLFGSSEGQNHNRIVFNVTSVHLQCGRELLISTSMDREVGHTRQSWSI